MALSDLLNKIESFDYNKVGTFQQGNLEDQLNSNPVDNLGSMNNPQTFEANGSVVTGEQSFERPLDTPLPISEALGFGPRSLLSDPKGVNFFGDVYANGFLVNAVDKETHYHVLGDEVSNYDPSLGFQNTWLENVFSFNDTPFQVTEAVNPKPSVTTPGGTTFEWQSATKPLEVNFFDKDSESPHAIGFSADMKLTKYQGISGNTYNSTSDIFKDTYIDNLSVGIDSSNPLSGDSIFFPNTNFSNGTFNIESTAYRRQSGRISDMTSNDSNLVNTDLDSGDASFLSDLLTASKFIIKSSDANYTYQQLDRNSYGYPIDYVSSFIPGGKDGDVQVTPGDGLSEFGKLLRDEKRVMKIPVNGNGRAIEGRSALSDPLRMGDGFVDYIQKMSGGNSQPFIVRRPGNDYGLDTIDTSFSQGNLLQGFGKVLNFLDEIAGGFVRGTPTFSGRISREIDDAIRKGKFIFTTEGITFGIKQFFLQANNRTIESRIWNPASIFSTPDFVKIPRNLGSIEYEGMLLNPAETIKDALPSFVPDFMADIFLEGLTGDRTPTSRVAEQVGWIGEQSEQAIPASAVESTQQNGPEVVLKSIVSDLSGVKEDVKKLMEGPPELRPSQRDLALPPKIDLTATIGPVKPNITLMDKLKRTISKFSPGAISGRLERFGLGLIPNLDDLAITFHNPNHFYRFRGFGLFDIYGGPEDGLGAVEEAQRLKNRLTSGTDRDTTITFMEEGSNLEKLHNKANYNFLTYGQIGDGVSYEQGLKDKATGKQQEATRNAGVNGFLSQPIIEDSSGDLTPPGVNLLQEFDTDMNQSNYHDRVNAYPISETLNVPVDWVDFRFETFQYGAGNVKRRRTIVFRASLNNVNENVQPNYNEVKYLGRPEKFYVYDGVDRDVNIDFTIYPKTAQEFPFLTEKLNYLVGLAYPQYDTNGLMIAPYVDLTLGDMFRRQPGYISNLAINVQDNTTWETEWFQFPKHITATLTFRYIGRHKPHQFGKHYDLPWLAHVGADGATTYLDATDTSGAGEESTPYETLVNRVAPEEVIRVEEFDIERLKSGWRGNTIKALNQYDKKVTGRVKDPDNPGQFTTDVTEGDVFDNE